MEAGIDYGHGDTSSELNAISRFKTALSVVRKSKSLPVLFRDSAQRKGFFITTSDFTKDANDYAAMIDSRIVLINGVRLCNLMIDHGIGVTRATSYEVKRLDSDYFEES